MQTLTLGHSPDADDLVMWWPLTGTPEAPGLPAIDTGGLAFRALAADIQALNERARHPGDLDITALSAFTYPFVQDRYRVTACGGSFGDGYGPKVVVRQDSPVMCDGCLRGQRPRVAVPGLGTTAFLVLSMLMDGEFDHEVLPFDRIAPAVAEGRAQAGLLIHEAQLTHAELGLREVVDLGAWWKARTGALLPLGLNVQKRDLSDRLGPGGEDRVAALLKASVAHARRNPGACRRVLEAGVGARPEWADDGLVERYLGMYVNDPTEDMGAAGRESLQRLFAEAAALELCPPVERLDVIG
jgi:1,4-dihydroxy-6-naphthoate synthase